MLLVGASVKGCVHFEVILQSSRVENSVVDASVDISVLPPLSRFIVAYPVSICKSLYCGLSKSIAMIVMV